MSTPSRGKTGATTSAVEYSPRKRKAMAKARQRQSERWAAKAGPVVTRQVGDPKPDYPLKT